jgi:NDP-sugar pyrophosphorylase family protein
VRIGDGAVVERSILWDSAKIGARVCVRGSIVGIEYEVPADTALIDRIVANEPIST